jgi:muramidase (phage lysozyme)
MSSERQILEQWAAQNPGLFRGLQRAISGAEGTLRGGRPGYDVMFGGGRFTDFSRHPDRVIRSQSGVASAAAGAYQFMPGTWSGIQQRLGLNGFSPQDQDLGMLKKVRDRLMPLGGLAAITKAGQLTPEIQNALAPEWASFPTLSGRSFYGQPVKKSDQIQKYFNEGMASSAPLPQSTPQASQRVEKGNSFGRGLIQTVIDSMKYLPMTTGIPSLLDTPPLDSSSFLKAYQMFFDPEEFS